MNAVTIDGDHDDDVTKNNKYVTEEWKENFIGIMIITICLKVLIILLSIPYESPAVDISATYCREVGKQLNSFMYSVFHFPVVYLK